MKQPRKWTIQLKAPNGWIDCPYGKSVSGKSVSKLLAVYRKDYKTLQFRAVRHATAL